MAACSKLMLRDVPGRLLQLILRLVVRAVTSGTSE